MSRTAREKSSTGFYHVTDRGVGRLAVFEGDDDKRAFLNRTRIVLADEPFIGLLAWAVMDNHFHFLVEDQADRLPHFMARVVGPYAGRFNREHGHVGHVFQDRHHTVPIEDDRQLLETVRYIHQNPARSGKSESCDVPWTSYREYLGTPDVTSTELVLDLLGGVEGFVAFHSVLPSTVETVEAQSGRARLSDEEADAVVTQLLGPVPLQTLGSLSRAERDAVLRRMKELHLSIRQIERRTGIGRSIIARA